jgi:hypothetical protein
LVRKFDLFPGDTPNNELLWGSWEKQSLGRGVDGVDVLDNVRGGEEWARFNEGSKGHAVQLEELHLRQFALGV